MVIIKIMIDEDLKLKNHINHVVNKVNRMLGLLKKNLRMQRSFTQEQLVR